MEEVKIGELKKLLAEIRNQIAMPNIVSRADYIGRLLDEVEEDYPDSLLTIASEVKTAVQNDARMAWFMAGEWGMEAMATGTGKSKIAIDIAATLARTIKPKIGLLVPTEKLRDENWKEEFEKWGFLPIYEQCVTKVCYASIDNIENQDFDFVIADEGHNITELNSVFFRQNRIKRLIVLTATPPTDLVKIAIFKSIHIKIDYMVHLDEAVKLRLTAPYNITIIEGVMDNKAEIIKAGTKAKPFWTTEARQYAYLTKLANQSLFQPRFKKLQKFRMLDRMRFIKNLQSTTKKAKFILENYIEPTERVLIFCGSIAQANEICEHRFHSETDDTSFNLFKEGKINMMSCVNALNEGHNLNGVTTVIDLCPESGEKTITQRIGRGVRFVPGHVCRVILLAVLDTVAMNWIAKALITFDKSKIRRVRYENLVAGSDKL